MKLSLGFLIPLMFSLAASADARSDSFREALGPRFNSAQSIRKNEAPKKDLDSIHRWNQIAIDASGLDHTPVAPGENRVFGEQLGPGRSSRAMAIVHIAIFDAVESGDTLTARVLVLVISAMTIAIVWLANRLEKTVHG